MPRKKTFVVEDALDAAIELFGERGYLNTTMEELALRLGLSRSSIYATFGDKQSLFAQTLQRYSATGREPGMHALRGDGSPHATLVSVFEWLTGADRAQQRGQGLLISAALESSHLPPTVAQALQDMLLDMETHFQGAIKRAQGAGEVAGNVDPVHTARALLGLYLGLAVLVRFDAKEPVLRAVVQQARSLLPAPS